MSDSIPLVERIERLLPKKPVEALEYCRELRGIALEKRKYELLAREEGFRGRGYIAISRVHEGRQSLSQALDWYRRRKLLDSCSSLINSVGADYYQLHEYSNARSWLASAVQTAVEANAPLVLYKALYNLGKVEQQVGNLSKARIYLEKSLEVAGKSTETGSVSSLLRSLGAVCRDLGDNRKAELLLKQGQMLASRDSEWAHSLGMILELAELMMQEKRYQEARSMYQEAAAAARARRMPRFEVTAMTGLGRVLLALGDSAVLMQVLQRTEQMLKKFPALLSPETAEVYKCLAIAYQKLFGDQERSYRYYIEYRKTLDLIHVQR